MEEMATENLELTEAKSNGAAKQRIKSRISLVKNRLRLPVNAAVASTAVTDYVNISQKNPRLSHYGILQKMSGPKRDALSAINSAVPVRMIVNAPDTQLRRTIRIKRTVQSSCNASSKERSNSYVPKWTTCCSLC
jgi:hypothetical protein